MNIEQYERIEAYLKGNLNTEEASSFEQEMQADATLQEEVDVHRLMHETIVESNLAEFRERMRMLDPNEVIQTRFWKKVLVVSVSAVGLALMTLAVLHFTDKEPEKLNSLVQPIPEDNQLLDNTTAEKNAQMSLLEESEVVLERPTEMNAVISPQVRVQSQLKSVRVLKSKHRKPDFEINSQNVATFQTPDVLGSPLSKPMVDCELELAAISEEIKPSCYGQESGEVLFTGSFLDKVDFSGQEVDARKINELKEGAYEFTLNTKSGCSTKRKVIVESVFCAGDQSFAPSEGQYWLVPTFNLGGTVVIYGLDGEKCFESVFTEGESVEWNGESDSGRLMPRGEYYYEVKFSNGKQLHDKVSLLF